MAWSSAEISAADLALLAADKPILGSNAIPASPTTAIWSEVGGAASTDRTYAGYPTSRAFDGLCHYYTRPDITTTATWYLVFNFGSTIEFDFIAILGHNFYDIGVTAVTLEVSDAADFSGAVSIPVKSSFANNLRFIQLAPHHTGSVGLRYSSVQYARLKITHSGNFTVQPLIRELILGRRCQLKRKPNAPYDPTSLHSSSSLLSTEAGVVYAYAMSMGRRNLEATLEEYESTYIEEIIAWFRRINYGTAPFLWIENPTTSPASWNFFVLSDSNLNFPVQNYLDRVVQISAIEQGPESYYLDRGLY
jgi:hypothetical protein